MIKLFKFLKPYKVSVFLAICCLLLQSLLDLYLPTLMADIVNKGILEENMSFIYSLGGKMLGITILSSIFSLAGNFFSTKAVTHFSKDIRFNIFNKVESFSLEEFNTINTSSLITRTTNDVTQVQGVMIMGFRFLLFSPLMCIGGIIMAVNKDKQLSMILIVSIPILITTIVIIAKKIIPLFKIVQEKIDKLNLVIRESLTGIRVIRAFNKLKYDEAKFNNSNEDLRKVNVKANNIMAYMQPIIMLIMNLTSLAIVWFGGLRVSSGNMDIGNMMAFLQYAATIMFSVFMVAIMFVMIPRAQVSAVRINEVLELENKILDPKETKVLGSIKSAVTFKNVSFFHPNAEEATISNISFTAKKGETTAIIGGTGAGKSTLLNLIPRFYDVTEGSIFLDDVNIKNLSQKDLHDKIGFVPQGSMLFSGTVSENIRFGKKDASSDEIIKAAKISEAYDFVMDMENGFDSYVAQGGTNLSGGQRQRLSIARAIVSFPEICIFDDSFSALDYKTDAKLRKSLSEELAKNSIIIIVAQRISTVINADKILVMEDGKIIGSGTHSELLKTCDVYKEILDSQLSREEYNEK